MDDSSIEEVLRTKLYNFYCELGWDCHTAELLAENIEIPTAVLDSFYYDMGPDQDSCMEA